MFSKISFIFDLKVMYLSITKPLFSINNLIFSTCLFSVTSEKHTFIVPFSTSKGIAPASLAVSIEIYLLTSIFISASVRKSVFSPRISPIAFSKIIGFANFKSYKISPSFSLVWMLWYAKASFISSCLTIPLLTNSIPKGCLWFVAIIFSFQITNTLIHN